MGLGLLGRGVGDIAFMAECGAEVLVTDLKSAEVLEPSLKKLQKYKNITYRLGEHRLEDFKNKDFILKAASVPLDSLHIAEAKKNNIPVEMSASLFAKLTDVPLIGITGTRGKSTVTHLIYHILTTAKKKVLLGGNVVGVSTLALLPKAKSADYAVFELDSWQLQGFGDSEISPQVAVFTTFMDDHLAYYKNDRSLYFKDKANIFMYQKEGDWCVVGKQVAPMMKEFKGNFITAPTSVKDFPTKLKGAHNLYNVAIAVIVARRLGINDSVIKKGVKSFVGVPGRLEFVRAVKGVSYYNDTTATTPDATIAALRALGDIKKKNIVLIMGGSDKNLSFDELLKIIPKYCKAVIFLFGTGTERLKVMWSKMKVPAVEYNSMKYALEEAKELAKKGDIVLLSPACASFGLFKNEYDRGEQFNRIVGRL